jgi:NADPH:quinone reductase-like Zn-dependent oxidoreductase
VSTVPSQRILFDALTSSLGRGPRARLVVVRARRRDLETLLGMLASGALRPQVERALELERTAEGHAHLETRRATGKVVIAIGAAAKGELADLRAAR